MMLIIMIKKITLATVIITIVNIIITKIIKKFLGAFKQIVFNPLSVNPTKWWNTLKQFVGNFPRNCLSVFDHFVILALKELTQIKLLFFMSHFCMRGGWRKNESGADPGGWTKATGPPLKFNFYSFHENQIFILNFVLSLS